MRQNQNFGDPDDRKSILNLVGLMAVRNPRHRLRLNEFNGRVSKRMLGLALETPERWEQQVSQAKAAGYIAQDVPAGAHYETIKARLEEGQYDIVMPRERHIALELMTHEKILPYLFGRRWTLFSAQPDAGTFITSDHPVCLTWADPDLGGGFYPPGFGLRGGDISAVCGLTIGWNVRWP